MIKYFQLSDIKEVSGQCPLYGNCETGRVLPPEYCARYRCNTFHQVDTIKLFLDSPWGPKAAANSGGEEKTKETSGVAKIVERHLRGDIEGNGNSNGNEKSGRKSIIAASFSAK